MKALQTLRYRTIQIIRGTESKGGGRASPRRRQRRAVEGRGPPVEGRSLLEP
jgi:hypothetical protein